ncbi:MAG: D-2-hydroxyacid dehydrogenase [Rhizobiaceae bacterium]
MAAPEHLKDNMEAIARKFEDSADFVLVKDECEAILENVDGVHGILGCPRHHFTEELVSRNNGALRWLHVGGAGVEQFMIERVVTSDIVLTNGQILQGPECADHALALLLCLSRNLKRVITKAPTPHPRPIELRGKSAVIVGVGGIGMLIAERLNAFGVRVTGVDADLIPMLSTFERTVTVDRLNDVVGEADFVLCAAPHTATSNPLFDEAFFNCVKMGAYFVNVSRGRLVDTDALVAALVDGRVGAAGLDVTDPEPLPENHPLTKMENVVVSPHIAGLSDLNRGRTFDLMEENVRRFISGEPLLNVVNKTLGY